MTRWNWCALPCRATVIPLLRRSWKPLKGTVIAADKWKNWWDKVRAMLRSNVQFMMPTRKGERITLRANILSRAQAALEDYNKAADLKAKVRVLDGIKMEAVMAEPGVTLRSRRYSMTVNGPSRMPSMP